MILSLFDTASPPTGRTPTRPRLRTSGTTTTSGRPPRPTGSSSGTRATAGARSARRCDLPDARRAVPARQHHRRVPPDGRARRVGLTRMVMADRPGVKTAPMPETAITLAELGARMATTMATLPLHQPWRGPGVGGRQHRARERARDPQDAAHLRADPAHAAAALAREVPRRPLPRGAAPDRDAATASRSRTARSAGSPACGSGPRVDPTATDPLPPRRRLPRDHTVDVLDVHGRARARDRVRPLHRRLPARARVPVPRRARGRDAGLRGDPRRRPPAAPRSSSPATPVAAGSRRRCSRTRAPQHLPEPAGAILFSPEVDLVMGEPSVKANARHDVLPDEIPVHPVPRRRRPEGPAGLGRLRATCTASRRRSSRTAARRCSATRSRSSSASWRRPTSTSTTFKAPYLFHVYEILMPWADASKETIASVVQFVDQQLDR